jgi:hypothetical protein
MGEAKRRKALVIAAAAMIACSIGSNAKVLEGENLPANWNQLRNADSFSIECKNFSTGVIDRETVDTVYGTVTIEVPGAAPIVHHITSFAIDPHPITDRFGSGLTAGWEMELVIADWAQRGSTGIGLLRSPNGRWSSSHEDGSAWFCADPRT